MLGEKLDAKNVKIPSQLKDSRVLIFHSCIRQSRPGLRRGQWAWEEGTKERD